jgi:hypothetical protein
MLGSLAKIPAGQAENAGLAFEEQPSWLPSSSKDFLAN